MYVCVSVCTCLPYVCVYVCMYVHVWQAYGRDRVLEVGEEGDLHVYICMCMYMLDTGYSKLEKKVICICMYVCVCTCVDTRHSKLRRI